MASRGAHHARTGGLHPRKTAFDMSFEHKGTCELGRLIPVMCEEVYPGEFWDLKVQSLIRFHPQVAPLLHEINVLFHDFFVPSRILWRDWEEFISGGAQGTEADTKGLTWPTTRIRSGLSGNQDVTGYLQTNPGTLWDYIYGNISHYGFPSGSDPDMSNQPIDAPLRVYWNIWNEYYRDENQEPRKGESTVSVSQYDPELLYQPNDITYWQPAYKSWVKDYFTSALPFQQRGTAPAFPITFENPGAQPVLWDNVSSQIFPNQTPMTGADPVGAIKSLSNPGSNSGKATYNTTSNNLFVNQGAADFNTWQYNNNTGSGVYTSVEVGPASVTLGAINAHTFDVNYLRYAVQIQKILERNARGGVRYTEWLYGHFGDRPRDERLQRPEYIGGAKSSVSISEVLQTSATNDGDVPAVGATPQGTMAGHAISVSSGRTGKYRVHEHGYIMRIMCIMPTPSYEDGIERMWFRRNRYDYLMPELVNLSEQGILNEELYADGSPNDKGIWGYQPQYDELRIRRNRVSGELRVNIPGPVDAPPFSSLSYWHLGRAFSALPPLSKGFINYDGPTLTDRVMAVRNVHPLIFSVGNIARAVRPLPYIGEPGLVDHH